MTLENGDRVLARINFDNAEETDEWHLRLPVGRWVPLELSDEGEKTLSYYTVYMDRSDYYMDMMGDFGRAWSETDYIEHSPAYKTLYIGMMLAALSACWRFFSKKHWF